MCEVPKKKWILKTQKIAKTNKGKLIILSKVLCAIVKNQDLSKNKKLLCYHVA